MGKINLWVGINTSAIRNPPGGQSEDDPVSQLTEAEQKVILTLEMKAGCRTPRMARYTIKQLTADVALLGNKLPDKQIHPKTIQKALKHLQQLGHIRERTTDSAAG